MTNPESGTFYEQHQPGLERVFELVGVDPAAAAALETAHTATQPWVVGDHVCPAEMPEVSEGASPELHGLYREFGLHYEWKLPAEEYDEVLVLGGMHHGNNRRLAFLGEAAGSISTNHIVMLGGERPVYEADKRHIAENLREIAERPVFDAWLRKLQAGEAEITWETDMLRLAAIARLGQLAYAGTDSAADYEGLQRPHVQTFQWGDIPVYLQHTAAVDRAGGVMRRHTTEACITDWVETFEPARDASVAFIVANPHISRTARVANAVLRRMGREDISLTAAGPETTSSASHGLYLGEIARHLHEDVLATAS